jgi:hypothetical protein
MRSVNLMVGGAKSRRSSLIDTLLGVRTVERVPVAGEHVAAFVPNRKAGHSG